MGSERRAEGADEGISGMLHHIKAHALLWKLTGAISEWGVELQGLEQELDRIARALMAGRLPAGRLAAWHQQQAGRTYLEPDERLAFLLQEVEGLLALEQALPHVRVAREEPPDPQLELLPRSAFPGSTFPGSAAPAVVSPGYARATRGQAPGPISSAEQHSELSGSPQTAPLQRSGARATDEREGREAPLKTARPSDDATPFDLPMPISIALALDLVPWVLGRDTELQRLLNRLRQTLYAETGVRLPPIHLVDSSTLSPGSYRLVLRGEEAAHGKLRGLECLVLEAPPDAFEGTPGQEPAFGMSGIWVAPNLRELARNEGYTVLSPVDMFLAHITEVLRSRLHELYGAAQLAQDLALMEARMPGLMTPLRKERPGDGMILRVLRLLLEEGLSIRDLDTLFEAFLEHGREATSAEVLAARVRKSMRRHISARFVDEEGVLHAFVLAGDLESRLVEYQRDEGPVSLPVELRARLLRGIQHHLERWNLPVPPVLVCPDLLRFTLRRVLQPLLRVLPVVAVGELASEVRVRHCGELSIQPALGVV